MKDMKVVFMGTPYFAKVVLEKLINYVNVVGVVCQPDKLVGRKKVLTMCPVKEFALDNNILVLQPNKLRLEYNDILRLEPDMIITCAYGQILPKELLEYPEYKTINVHGSLLPELRGGAPIQHSIIRGYDKTGITIMRTDVGMDDGDMISKKEVEILDSDNYDSLNEKLAIVGADLLIETLPSIFSGSCEYITQDHSLATFAYTIKREDEHIDFNRCARDVFNHIRGLAMNPGGFAILDDVEVKLFSSYVGEDISLESGVISNVYKNGIGVACLDKELIITKIQVPGKRVMDVRDYLNGVKKDELLGKKFS